MDKQNFRKRVAAFILKEVPQSRVVHLDNFVIRMEKGEYWLDLTLENFYHGYCRHSPSLRENYLTEVLAPFIKDLQRECGVNYRDVSNNQDKIYPLLVGTSDTRSVVTTHLLEDLHVAYVLDEGMRIFFLDQKTLNELSWPVNRLHHVALKNFSRDLLKPLQMFDPKRRIYGFNYGDSYDSTRLLSLLGAPAEQGFPSGQRVLIMVPNRDVVLLFSPGEKTMVRQSVMIGRSSFINNPYPISEVVFQLQGGILQRYQELC